MDAIGVQDRGVVIAEVVGHVERLGVGKDAVVLRLVARFSRRSLVSEVVVKEEGRVAGSDRGRRHAVGRGARLVADILRLRKVFQLIEFQDGPCDGRGHGKTVVPEGDDVAERERARVGMFPVRHVDTRVEQGPVFLVVRAGERPVPRRALSGNRAPVVHLVRPDARLVPLAEVIRHDEREVAAAVDADAMVPRLVGEIGRVDRIAEVVVEEERRVAGIDGRGLDRSAARRGVNGRREPARDAVHLERAAGEVDRGALLDDHRPAAAPVGVFREAHVFGDVGRAVCDQQGDHACRRQPPSQLPFSRHAAIPLSKICPYLTIFDRRRPMRIFKGARANSPAHLS